MNWEAIGAAGDLLGGIGVIITLGYLALQIRQNTAQVRENVRLQKVAAHQEVLDTWSRYRRVLASNKQAAEVLVQGGESIAALSPAEREQYRCLVNEYLFSAEATFIRVRQGLMEQERWESIRGVTAQLMTSSGFRSICEETAAIMSREFSEVLRELLQRDLNGLAGSSRQSR